MSSPTLVDVGSRTMAKRKLKLVKKQNHLTAHERQSLPRSDFALPGHGEGKKGAGAGSYPIPDAGHARAALSRVSANGTSEEKAEVRRKVHEKFPNIGKSKRSKLYDHARSHHHG